MLLHQVVAGALRRRSMEAIVRQVAEQSLEAVCRLVADSVAAMPLCEARGYVRARAAREVRRQTRRVLADRQGADPAWEAAIVARAADRVSPLALRQLSSMRSRAAAMRPVSASQRRAA